MNLIRVMPAEECEMPDTAETRLDHAVNVGGTLHLDDLPGRAGAILARIRGNAPRVHCITNNVAQAFTANMLLALGAVPSMSHAPEEVPDFAARADAVLVNLGTLDAERRASTRLAADTALRQGKPWALDPVFVQASPPRRALAADLVQRGPTLVRANAEEFAALVPGDARAGGEKAVVGYAAATGAVICRTGEIDFVTDGVRALRIENGHPLLTRVTAVGCAGTALMCAALAVEPDGFVAAAAMLLMLGVAGEIAAESARGSGSFAVELLDSIYNLDERALRERARIDT